MSMKERLAKKAAAIGTKPREPKQDSNPAPRQASTGPGQLFAFMGMQKDLQEENARLKQRIDELEAAGESNAAAVVKEQIKNLESGKSFMAKLSALQDAEFGRRNLSEQEFSELRENLRLHPLIHPITVRKLDDTRLEIISGHNRAAAYRELGRETIPATFLEVDDTQAADAAFFANLLQPKMADYEKFLNLRRYQLRHPDISHEEIAGEIGIDRSVITRLLSFGELPDEALEFLQTAPRTIGSRAAAELAGLSKQGIVDSILPAIKAVADGVIEQGQVAGFAKKLQTASTERSESTPKPEVTRHVFRRGKKTVCEVRATGGTLRIEIKDSALVDALREEITKRIESFVDNRND